MVVPIMLHSKNVPAGTDIANTAYWQEVTDPSTVGDKMSTRPKDLEINDAILTQAYADVPLSGYDTVTKFYILPTQNGQPAGAGLTADDTYPTVDGTEGGEGNHAQGLWLHHGLSNLVVWILTLDILYRPMACL
jgi:hypothetical protein